MPRTVPTIKEDAHVDRDSIKSNLKYINFGIKLWTLREKSKIRTKQMAEKLGISYQEYRRYEAGEALPNQNLLIKIANQLDVDLSQLMSWSKKEEQPAPILKGAKKLLHEWDLAEQEFRKNWRKHHGENKTFDLVISDILKNLKKEVCATKTLPVLPLGLYLVLDVLLNDEHKNTRAIKEIENFVMAGENLPDYIAKEPILGSFLFMAANRLFFSHKPLDSLELCLNSLTFQQFSDLIFFATAPEGLHVQYETLPALQQYIEFSSLGILMTREIKPFLADNINYNHLYMAALMQPLGIFALNTVLFPIVDQNPNWMYLDKGNMESEDALKKSIIQHLNWEFHPVISAMIAANWNFPAEVIQTLKDHHKQPVDSVSPTCAVLKLINFFVDCNFPRLQPTEVPELLAKYPQLKFNTNDLLAVTKRMNHMSEHLIEMNSAVFDTKQKNTDSQDSIPVEMIDLTADPMCSRPVWTHNQKNKNEFRFDTEYSKILTIDCSQKLNAFFANKLFPMKGESLHAFGERIQNLQLALYYALGGDVEDVSSRFQIPVEEVALRLKL